MSALLILTTGDATLAADWRAQLPPSYSVVAEGPEDWERELARPGARVWIRDVAHPRSQLRAHRDTVVVVVGQPQSIPFEQAKMAGEGRFFLSYEESRSARLGELVRTAAELAEKNAIISTLEARRSQSATTLASTEETPGKPVDGWEFLEAAIEHLADRGRVLEEFERAARSLLQASRVAIFLREGEAFRSSRGGWSCAPDSLLARSFGEFPCLVNLDRWECSVDAATESQIRQQMQLWGTRLLVPLQEVGRLAGWAAFGPRADGRPYGTSDQARALGLGRLLERCLDQSGRLEALAGAARQEELRARHLPRSRLLGPDAASDLSVPPEVRALAGAVLRSGQGARLDPGPTVRFRAEAGPVPETGGVWVQWSDGAAELAARSDAIEQERLKLCRELGLTLSHELGSPQVTFSTFLQLMQQGGATSELTEEFGPPFAQAVDRMRTLGEVLRLMQEFMSGPTSRIDLGDLCRSLELRGRVRVVCGEMSPVIQGNEPMLRFALQMITDGLLRQQAGADAGITLGVKRRGEGPDETGLLVFAGRDLRLEGFLDPMPGGAPVHPLLAVFLAREIIHWHQGSLQGGQGLTGGEVQIALKSRRPVDAGTNPAPARSARAPSAVADLGPRRGA